MSAASRLRLAETTAVRLAPSKPASRRRRSTGTSPTQLSLRRLRDAGYDAEVTEKWIARAFKRKDLFGFGDVLAINDEEHLIVQTSTLDNFTARVNKILGECRRLARRWLRSGGRIEVHGWFKNKPSAIPSSHRWEARVRPITLEDFVE